MEPIILLKGLIIGFAMAIPIGSAGVMCIQKTLAERHSRGLIVGLGAATADSIYGSIAAFGLTMVSNVIASEQFWLRLGGGGFLLFFGIRIFFLKLKDSIFPFFAKGLWGLYASAFLLGLANPVIVIAFIAVFAAFGLGHILTVPSTCLLILGVFTGECLWFLTLGYVAIFFRKKLNSRRLRLINRISGMVIIASGIAVLVSLIAE